ncbi:MAG: thermonuclease family protein [Hyphomicrobiales bacterium]
MARRWLLPLFVAAVLLGACELPADDDNSAGLPPCTWADVVRVTDGDTIVVDLVGREERVRYIGMDTPEVAGSPGGAEPFGSEASAANKDLLRDGRVCLERDVSERDRYGRLLRYAWLADGRMAGEELVREGLARVATFPPDVKYIDSRLLPAQREAQQAGRGLWGEPER